VIEQAAGEPLQALLERLGYLRLRELEAQWVAQCDLPERAVVAPGAAWSMAPRPWRA
jgi:shikimate kinase